MTEPGESLHSQIERLAQFIMSEMPGEPSQNQGAVDTAIRLMTEWKDRAEKLWDIVDDIDTYSDLVKGNDKLYRNLVHKKQAERHDILASDGYILFVPGTVPETPEDQQLTIPFNTSS